MFIVACEALIGLPFRLRIIIASKGRVVGVPVIKAEVLNNISYVPACVNTKSGEPGVWLIASPTDT